MPRDLDLVVFGATGFTGKLVTEHLARSYSSGGNKVRYVLAGRDKARLEAARAQVAKFAPLAAEAEIVAVDPSDHDALVGLFGRAKAVISTAGPYHLYGTPIVKAAVVSYSFLYFLLSFFLSSGSFYRRRGCPPKKKRLIPKSFSLKILLSLSIKQDAGAHYCDITGELSWVASLRDDEGLDEKAKAAGVKVVSGGC